MFWKLTSLSASSPVESVLDKENFTLEELLDEEEIIQECRALNSRLINFLRDRTQVEQLLRYIVEDAPEEADNERAFKFPFIACEIFTCEIDVILKTLVDEQELMDLLFSFLEPNRPHSTLLAGYFSKVVICLMLRKTVPLMNYVQAHQDVFSQLVDLIGITSIMEVLTRLVGADDHIYPNYTDVMQWLADINLLEMIVDKLNTYNPPEVHANAAETLCAITRTVPSPLATRLSSPSFVSRLFGHALEDAHSKSALIHTLSVFISLLDPSRSIPTSQMYSFRCQHIYESSVPANPDTVRAMLPKLGDLLRLLSVSADAKILPTTFGELRPPLGKHRLKIVEFIAVLLKSGNDVAEEELISSGTIQRILDLLFEYPYNNALHHNVESIIYSCLESNNDIIVNHLLDDCNLVGKILQADKHPTISGDSNKPTIPASGKMAPKAGYLGHLTRISNKLIQLGNSNRLILAHIQENSGWNDWQTTVLLERNAIENVYRWGCGRPTALQDRTRDSEEEDAYDRDYDVTVLANNLSQAFKYNIYDNDETEEDKGALDRDDEDAYFDDESGEVVISSMRLGDDSGSLFTNSNWFAFQDDRTGDSMSTSPPPGGMDEINGNGTSNRGINCSDDDVLFGKDEELTKSPNSGSSSPSTNGDIGSGEKKYSVVDDADLLPGHAGTSGEKKYSVVDDADLLPGHAGTSGDLGFFHLDGLHDNPYGDRHTPEGANPSNASGGSSIDPFLDQSDSSTNFVNQVETAGTIASNRSTGDILPNGTSTSDSSSDAVACDSSPQTASVPSLFEEDVEFAGVELEGTEKAMEQALREGIVGEAGPLKRNAVPKIPGKENSDESGLGMKEFNDATFWRVDQEVAALE